MNRLKYILGIMVLLTVSCSPFEDYEGGYEDTPVGNFDALWHIMDTRYCFFSVKKEQLGVDWDSVYAKYRPAVSDKMGYLSLFEVMANMLGELQDGHVNLYGPNDIARNWHWESDYPENFSAKVQELYLDDDYLIAGSGYSYTILDDNTGYITMSDFSSNLSDNRLDAVLSYFSICNGIIIDIRGNGGGSVELVERIASRFTNENVHVGYFCYKTGPGHDDFSERMPRSISPATGHIRWQKPIAVLTNRSCFSAANDFASIMKVMPKARLFGDRTGGGGGMPVSSELPCGWSVRFSSSPTFDADGNDIETGVDPDVFVSMTESDTESDPIIEAAREWIGSLIIN